MSRIFPRRYVLINANFTKLWVGQSISFLGDAFLDTTLYLWVATGFARGQTWLPLALGGLPVAVALPALVVGPLAGVFVDRWHKQRLMLRMDAARAGLVFLLLPLLFVVPLPLAGKLISIYAIIMLTSACAQFFNPSRLALLGDIVPASAQVQASGSSSAAFNLALILGPSAATILFFALGPFWAIAFDALSFVASFALIQRIAALPFTPPLVKESSSYWAEFTAGMRALRANHVVMVLLITGIGFNVGTGIFNAFYVLFALHNLHTPPPLVGIFAASYGAMVILGSLLAGRIVRVAGEARVFGMSLTLWGCMLIVFAHLTTFIPGLVLFALLGFANAGINVVVGPLLLKATPRAYLGRIQAVFSPAIVASSLLATTCAGIVASTWLRALHLVILGVPYQALNVLLTVAGLLSIGAGGYAGLTLSRSLLHPQTPSSSR